MAHIADDISGGAGLRKSGPTAMQLDTIAETATEAAAARENNALTLLGLHTFDAEYRDDDLDTRTPKHPSPETSGYMGASPIIVDEPGDLECGSPATTGNYS